MEGGFLLLFLRKGQADLGLMPRSQNHRLRAEKALSYQAGILSLGVHESPKIIFKIVASDSQKSMIPQKVKKHSKPLKLQMSP